MSASSHESVIERYLAAYNAFDVDGMVALLHPDVEFVNRANGEVNASARGREEFRQLAERAAALFASRRQRARDYLEQGDEVRITVEYQGVLASDLSPELRAGDTIQLEGHSTFRFRDGLIAGITDES